MCKIVAGRKEGRVLFEPVGEHAPVGNNRCRTPTCKTLYIISALNLNERKGELAVIAMVVTKR
jgi:hypothetical protein